MPIPVLSRKAYITITIGTLLLSGAFLVLSIDYANTTGVFYTERNTPIIHFTNELEALTSLLYSLPEDAYVEYRGPYACEWSTRSGKFVCEGGLEIEEVSAAVSFTKDERMLYTPRTACIYLSIGAVQAILGKGKKANVLDDVDDVPFILKQLSQGLEQKAKNRLSRFVDTIRTSKTNFANRMKRRLGHLKGLDPGDVITSNRFGLTKHELREKVLKSIKDGDITFTRSKVLKKYFKDEDEYADWIVDYVTKNPNKALASNLDDFLRNANPNAAKNLYGNAYYHLKQSESIRDNLVETITDDIRIDLGRGWFEGDDFEDWAALYPDKADLYTYVVDGQRYIKDIPTIAADRALSIGEWGKIKYYRDTILWAQTTASGYAAYRSCRSNDFLWELVDLLTGNQILFQVDLDSVDSFYDFYAGKYGAVTIDFSDGVDDITAVKSYGTNGEDMCFLRNQLSFFGGEYDTPALKMEDGKIVLSKNKETFDTLCDDDSDYYPIGVGEIAEYVRKACGGINQAFDVYVTPARFFSNEDGTLCEKHFARNEEGEYEGEFTLFCYDFADIECGVDMKFTDLSIDYGMKEGSIVEMNIIDQIVNPSLGDLRESGNTYWFKHTSYLLPSVTIDVPILGDVLDFIFGIFGADSPLDTLSEGLNTIIPEIPFDSRSLEEKPGFLQSMYYKCYMTTNKTEGIVTVNNYGCEPVVLMNWNAIMTEDYKCGDEICDPGAGENVVNCPTDCPPPLCLIQAPFPCDGCTAICNTAGYGTGTCIPFGDALPSEIGTWVSVSGARCNSIISALPVTGTCYCDTT